MILCLPSRLFGCSVYSILRSTFVYYVEGEGFKYRLCTAPFAFTHQLMKSQSVEIVSDELNTLSSVLSASRQTKVDLCFDCD